MSLKNRKALCLITIPVAILVMAAALATPALFSSPASADDEEEIRIISEEVTSVFPDNVTFRLTATGPDPIDEVRVFYKPVGGSRSTYGYLDIVPGTEVSGEYVMDTEGSAHRPPGTSILYSFEIRDTAGRVFRTEDKEYLYIDSALDWKEISDDAGLLTVYYYGDFVEKRAQTVLDTVQKTLEKMGPVLGITFEKPINIVSYSNYRDMARALPFRSQAVREGLRTEGLAYTSERVVLVLVSDTTFTGNVSHEFTHILVGDAAGQGYGRVPSWLNEGLAEYGNLDPSPHYDWALNYAIFTRRVKPLWYLDAFTGEPDDIIIYYGQGKSVVDYLIEVYGQEKMAELMEAFRANLSIDAALERVYGFDQYGLDTRWRRALGLDSLPSPDDEPTATPIPTPTGVPAPPATEARPTPEPTPAMEPTPVGVPEATAEPAAVSDEGRRRTSRSCGGPSSDAAHLPSDIAALALLGVPLLALGAGRGLGKKGEGRGVRTARRIKAGLRRFRRGRDHRQAGS